MRKLVIPLLIFVIVLVLLKFVFYIGYVPSKSMEPTIPANSKIIGIRIINELNVGDIIVFEHDGTNMVKRIAAVPGDTVDYNVVVPDNCYYVLGDNYLNSYDSRYWEEPFIKKQDIVAVLIHL